MTAVKLDQVKYFNLVDTYINYETSTADIAISGSVANGATANFSTTVNYSRTKTRGDIYLKNLTTGVKMPTSQGSPINPYTFKSSETCNHSVSYSSGVITVTVSVFNGTGAGITLTSQTLQVQVVAYEVPYSQ